MLPSSISLVCDPLSTGNITWPYEKHGTSDETGVSVYRGPLHQTNIFDDQITAKRRMPKVSGTFLGQCKGEAKITRTYAVADSLGATIKRPGYVAIDASFPNGITEDEVRIHFAMAAELAILELMRDLTLRQELA